MGPELQIVVLDMSLEEQSINQSICISGFLQGYCGQAICLITENDPRAEIVGMCGQGS